MNLRSVGFHTGEGGMEVSPPLPIIHEYRGVLCVASFPGFPLRTTIKWVTPALLFPRESQGTRIYTVCVNYTLSLENTHTTTMHNTLF